MKIFSVTESLASANDTQNSNADLPVIFVESDEQAIGISSAVVAAHLQNSVVVAAHDGTPELPKAISGGRVVGAGMQQPYLMGRIASERLGEAMDGGTPPKLEMVPMLTVTGANVEQRMPADVAELVRQQSRIAARCRSPAVTAVYRNSKIGIICVLSECSIVIASSHAPFCAR